MLTQTIVHGDCEEDVGRGTEYEGEYGKIEIQSNDFDNLPGSENPC
jgi:hypothetical protein